MLCQINKLKKEDLETAKSLLKEAGLPYEDVDEHQDTFLAAKVGNELIGAIGLEIWNDNALLRSFVVKEEYRKDGIGGDLYDKCIEMAKNNFVKTIALLTTTAESFFSKHGFEKINGENIPSFIKATKEFRVYCPSSSTIMIKNL